MHGTVMHCITAQLLEQGLTEYYSQPFISETTATKWLHYYFGNEMYILFTHTHTHTHTGVHVGTPEAKDGTGDNL